MGGAAESGLGSIGGSNEGKTSVKIAKAIGAWVLFEIDKENEMSHDVKVYRNGLNVGSPLTKEDEPMIQAAMWWIKCFAAKTKKINRKRTSYYFKHKAENAGMNGVTYISNGAFIEAARRLGFHIKQTEVGSPNCWFNFSDESQEARQKVAEHAITPDDVYNMIPGRPKTKFDYNKPFRTIVSVFKQEN